MAEIEYLGPLEEPKGNAPIEYLGPLDEPKKSPTIMDRIAAAPATGVLIGKEFLKGATMGLVDLPAPNAEKYLSDKGLELHPWAKTGGEIGGALAPMGMATKVTAPLVRAAYPAVAGTVAGTGATAGLSGMLYSAVESAVKGKPIMEGLRDMGFEGLTWAAQAALLDKAIKFIKGYKKVPEPNKIAAVNELDNTTKMLMPTVGEGPPQGIVRSNNPLKGGMVQGAPIEPLAGRGDLNVLYPQGGPGIVQRLRPGQPLTNTAKMPLGEGPPVGIARQTAPAPGGMVQGQPIEALTPRTEANFNYPKIQVRLRVPEPAPQTSPMPLIRRDAGFIRGQAGGVAPRLMADIAGAGTGAVYGAANDPESPTRGAIAGGAIGLGAMEGGRAGFNFLRDNGLEQIKRFFNPLRGLPGENEYLNLRNKTKGNVHRVENIIDRVGKTINQFDEPTRVQMFDFLDGKISLNQLPQNAQVTAENLRTMNNLVGKMLVKRGMLNPETFQANKDKYIRYMYAKHILADNGVELPPSSGKMDLTYLMHRQDLPESVRKAIGQIKDVAIAEPISIGKPLHDVVRFDSLKSIADDPRWTWQPPKVRVGNQDMSIGDLQAELIAQQRVAKSMPHVPEVNARLNELETAMNTASQTAQQAPEGFIKMPDTKSWGPLAGQFVRKEVYRDVVPLTIGFKDPGTIGKLINTAIKVDEKAMGMFKVGKTAFNVPTIARNNVSNVIQLNMSGIPLHEIPMVATNAAKHWMQKDQIYGQALRHGLFKTNWTQGEINEVLKTMSVAQSTPDKIFDKIADLSKYYGKIDDFWKLTKFTEQVEKGIDYKTAAREANKWVMDYSLVHPAIGAARRHIMPFVTYQYKMLPLVAETIKDRPFSMIKYFMIPPAMYEVSRQAMNFSEDDFKRLKKQLPLFIKKNQNFVPMPWKSPEGNVQWVNLEYFFPWQMVESASRSFKEGDIGEGLGDLGISHPFADVYSVFKSLKGDEAPKDPFSGKRIYNNLDTPTEKTFKLAEWVYNKWAPSMMTRFGALGTTAKYITGSEDRYGKQVSLPQAAGKWVGINIASPTKLQTNKEMVSRVIQNKYDLNSIIKDPTLPVEKKYDAIKRYRKNIKNIYGLEGE